MMETSAIPAALDGLVAMCQAQQGAGGTLEEVRVQDGPLYQRPTEKQVLIIGGKDVSDEAAVGGEQEPVSMPGREKDETFDILCTALAWSGGGPLKTVRDQAFEQMAAVERLLRPREAGSDHTLGGAVSWASVGGPITYDPMYTDQGVIVRLYFHIRCRARLSGS